ncbi:Bug family tripartite tricarboxylate transporter substrate binding protein [Polaromonas jejuensis]|uniref:Bug family tripartite tricarboxylate transporter substrate binding protein n=1 Tax=Polaromonas jejuensis TaxID=457502 RepID=A0ABW0QAW6_9BURK|nr:tripartite tricarboxylate transporter substrate binding protein [Polaromonas jejuensis]
MTFNKTFSLIPTAASVITAISALSGLAFLPLTAAAQAFPTKTITLVNPYAVGGPADQLARVLAKGLGEQLGQPVIVENKAGGGASIGAAFVAKAPADGYTLLYGTSAAHVVTPAATRVPYDGIKDFDFIGIVANVPNVLTVHPGIKANNVKEFIALVKSQPGLLSYASAGLGSSPHIGMEMFKYRTGTFLLHIPYRGAAPATTDMVAGTVPVGMLNISGVQTFIKANRLRALVYGGRKRSPSLPDVPTFAEAGIPNFISGSWYSLAAPAKTPAPVLDRLTKALTAVLVSPEFVNTAAQQSAEIYNFTRAQTRAFVQEDAKTMSELIKGTGIKLTD